MLQNTQLITSMFRSFIPANSLFACNMQHSPWKAVENIKRKQRTYKLWYACMCVCMCISLWPDPRINDPSHGTDPTRVDKRWLPTHVVSVLGIMGNLWTLVKHVRLTSPLLMAQHTAGPSTRCRVVLNGKHRFGQYSTFIRESCIPWSGLFLNL